MSFSASGASRIRLHVFRSEQTDATTSHSTNYYQATGALDRLSKHALNLKFRPFKFDHRDQMLADDGIHRCARKRAAWIDLME